MSDATMRATIKARLIALGPGIGRVHDFERWAVNAKDLLAFFQDPATKKIFGWEITRTSFRVQKATMAKWKWIHKYLIRGYYALADAPATEKAVNALADLIALDFTLRKLAGTQGDQLPEGKIEPRMFGNVLCHVVEILLPEVAEIVEQPPEAGETDLEAIGIQYYLTPGDETADAADEVTLGEGT